MDLGEEGLAVAVTDTQNIFRSGGTISVSGIPRSILISTLGGRGVDGRAHLFAIVLYLRMVMLVRSSLLSLISIQRYDLGRIRGGCMIDEVRSYGMWHAF